MAIGKQVTKADLDVLAPAFLLELDRLLSDGQYRRIAAYLTATPDAALVAMGYTQAEVNTLKSAYSGATGAAANWTANGLPFAKQVWGLGVS